MSDDASMINTKASSLLEENTTSIDVEKVLVNNKNDIEILKKNVSWLALHGGGGSGSGSSVEGDTTATFIDSTGASTQTLQWSTSLSRVRVMVSSTKKSSKYTMHCEMNGSVIWGTFTNQKSGTYTIDLPKGLEVATTLTMYFYAIDEYDNVAEAKLTLVNANINVSISDQYAINIAELSTQSVNLNYQVNNLGKYGVYFSTNHEILSNLDTAVYDEITIDTVVGRTYSIPLVINQRLLEFKNGSGELVNSGKRLIDTQSAKTGDQYKIYCVLQSLSDTNIFSPVASTTVVLIDSVTLVVSTATNSTVANNPDIISKSAVLSFSFISRLSGGVSNFYNVTAQKIIVNESTVETIGESVVLISNKNGSYNNVITETITNFYNLDFFEVGENYVINVNVTNNGDTSKKATLPIYIKVSVPNANLIPVKENYKIFEYSVFGGQPTLEWEYENKSFSNQGTTSSISTTLYSYNIGGSSGVKDDGRYYRYSNKAFGQIGNFKLNTANGVVTRLFGSSEKSGEPAIILGKESSFSIVLSYKADLFNNDNHTVFNLGNVQDTANGYGILINIHDYIIRLGDIVLSGVLVDNVDNIITIVFGEKPESNKPNYYIKIYQNGILLNVMDLKDLPEKYINYLYDVDNMLIAAKTNIDNKQTNLCNVNLYSIEMYATALTVYDVVCSYINHYAKINVKKNNNNYELDADLIENKLVLNGITRSINKDGVEVYTCPLVNDANTSLFSYADWISITNNQITLKDAIKNVCKLPIVVLDLQNAESDLSNFGNFKAEVVDENKVIQSSSIPIRFFTEQGKNILGEGVTVDVSIQGTTSKRYPIKNLNIDFGSYLFWAKDSWFPEQIYTLKADYVDSAHANNACIGNLINKCSEYESLLDKTPAMTYFNNNKNSNVFSLPTDNTLTIKHTLEGFPILLIAIFKDEKGNRNVQSLGIYSFNLGRDSYYNLGYQILKKFTNIDGTTVTNEKAPRLLNKPTSDDIINCNAESWEGQHSKNCTLISNVDFDVDTAEKTSMGLNNPNNFCFDGYFWSNTSSAIKYLWACNYPDSTTSESKIQELHTMIVKGLEYQWGGARVPFGTTYYTYIYDDTEKAMVKGTETVTLDRETNNVLTNVLSIKNSRFYYIMCMLTGLTDNLGKNMNLRIWKNPNISSLTSQWFPSFYDMDTAFGLNNEGGQNVRPDALDFAIPYDSQSITGFTMPYDNDYTNVRYTVWTNKLWGALDASENIKQYEQGGAALTGESFYAKMWETLRTNVVKDVDSFMNGYFIGQIANCGEILYNQDFEQKYVSNNNFNFMHGDRKSFVRKWLQQRIDFLDSLYNYMAREATTTAIFGQAIVDSIPTCSVAKTVDLSAATDLTTEMTYSTPLISKITLQNKTNIYSYVKENEPKVLRIANETASIVRTFSNADKIISIGNLKNYSIQELKGNPFGNTAIGDDIGYTADLDRQQWSALSMFEVLDLSNTKFTGSNPINFMTLFKSWNTMLHRAEENRKPVQPSQLREVYLQGTRLSGKTDTFDLNLGGNALTELYKNPFTNLTDIDISDSCVTSLSLPSDVSLYTFKFNNSILNSLNLKDQALLTTIDATDCNSLTEVRLENFAKLNDIIVSGLPKLNTIVLTSLPLITTFSFDGSNRDNSSNFSFQCTDMPNLQTLSITNIGSTNGELTLTGATNLTSLTLTNVKISTVRLSEACKSTLTTLNISNSQIKTIIWHDANTGEALTVDTPNVEYGMIDLRGLYNNKTLNFSCKSNIAVKYVRFDNIKDSPITLNTSFYGCTNLLRVFGNIKLNAIQQFYGCRNFSIHGSDIKNVTYNRISVMSGERVLHPKEMGSDVYQNGMVWQEGKEVSNFYLNRASYYNDTYVSLFSHTKCTLFDVYYVFCKNVIGKLTNAYSLFYNCSNVQVGNIVNVEDRTITDNSFSKYTFTDAEQITSLQATFVNCVKSDDHSFLVLKSPTHNNSGVVTANDGLFSPLTKLTNFNYTFGYITNILIDRFLFRRTNSTQYAITNLSSLSPRYIVDDVTKYENVSGLDELSKILTINDEGTPTFITTNCGNLTGFYENLGNVSYSFNTLRSEVIRYNTITNCPNSTLAFCFNAKYSSGKINLNNIFKSIDDVGTKSIVDISDSFISNGKFGDTKSVFEINSDTFKNLINLQHIRHLTGDLRDVKYAAGYCFTGDGIDKKVTTTDTNLNSIFANNDKLVSVEALFYNATVTAAPSLNIPADMFRGKTNLQSVEYLFYNLKGTVSDFKISLTSDGFADCSNLQNVNYIFANAGRIDNSQFNTSVPKHLFYHGKSNDREVTYTGITDVEYDVILNSSDNVTVVVSGSNVRHIEITIENNKRTTKTTQYENVSDIENNNGTCTFKCVPITIIRITTLVENIADEDNITTVSNTVTTQQYANYINKQTTTIKFTYPIYNRSITNMHHVFCKQKLNHYENTYPEIEINPNYQPFTYIKQSNVWSKVNQDTRRYTFMWDYDGVNLPDETETNKYNLTKLSAINNKSTVEEAEELMRDYLYLDDIKYYLNNKSYSDGDKYYVLQSGDIYNANGKFKTGITNYYAYAPDLFRYCSQDITDLSYTFYMCGVRENGNVTYINEYPSNTKVNEQPNWGLDGRIVPYTFYNTPNLLNISYMFKDCKTLSYFANGENLNNTVSTYMIPPSFFNYSTKITDLEGTFEGMSFPAKVNLNVFGALNGNSMNLRRAFLHARFQPGTIINGIFKNMKSYTNVSFCFTNQINETTMKNNIPSDYRISDFVTNESMYSSSNITFIEVFNKDTVQAQDTDYAVFAGYSSSSIETSNKTLNTETDHYNYNW